MKNKKMGFELKQKKNTDPIANATKPMLQCAIERRISEGNPSKPRVPKEPEGRGGPDLKNLEKKNTDPIANATKPMLQCAIRGSNPGHPD